MPRDLTTSELAEIRARYADLVNYSSEDPTDPIDPLIYAEPGGDSLIHIAALRGDVPTVRLLLEAGIDPNMLGDMGYTPLHYAGDGDHREVATLLLAAGAKSDVANEFGELPKKIEL